jgi:hypothetical protein
LLNEYNCIRNNRHRSIISFRNRSDSFAEKLNAMFDISTSNVNYKGPLPLPKQKISQSKLKTLYVSLVRPKLEYASFVWRPFYGVHIDRIVRVERKFVRYALRVLGWTDMCDLPPYVDRCALIRLETLAERRANACVRF